MYEEPLELNWEKQASWISKLAKYLNRYFIDNQEDGKEAQEKDV